MALLLAAVAVVAIVAALAVARPRGGPGPTWPPSPDSRAYNPGPVYGSGIGMDALNNTVVGGPDGTTTSYRFRATSSAALQSARIYVMGPEHAGYGAGTGGTIEASVQADDGTPRHAPSGTVLATTTFRPAGATFPVIAWPSPATLSAGTLYHVVFRNVDPRPRENYASVNGIYVFEPTVPRQPAFADTDWGQPVSADGRPWADSPRTTPIMELAYADGTTAGEGYMEVWVRSAWTVSGPAMAREAFTVSGADRTVASVGVRLMRLGGDGPLGVRLERADGTVVAEAAVPASDVAIGVPGDHEGPGHAAWVTATFPAPVVLASGAAYRLVLSAGADTRYSIFAIRKGLAYGLGTGSVFADGHAQATADGTTWTPFTQDGGGPLDEADLQFALR